MKYITEHLGTILRYRANHRSTPLMLIAGILLVANQVWADIPGRDLPAGAVPNPGTQQQELTNITAPGEFNVFEFVVTCAGCHGGSIDQHTAHFSNWAGGNMASAARDPIFRANQIGVNNTIQAVTGRDGAGNVCMRCHSPNGWLSGRFDPSLGGKADASNMIQSILLSTDGEGVMCETCHRVAGNVTFQRADLDNLDPAWNLLGNTSDWTHTGREMTDQAGDPSIGQGLPFGDTALQYQDNISYVGKYSGTGDLYFSDLPIDGSYTGQIYAIYPERWTGPKNPVPAGMPQFNSALQEIAYAADGSLPPVFEVPIGIPVNPIDGFPDYSLQSLSLEHPTTGATGRDGALVEPGMMLPRLPSGLTPSGDGVSSPNEFIRTSEFCGSCHDLTVPVLDHGMPEQRTYSEWKHSSYAQASNVIDDPLGKRVGNGVERCQDCHMPTLKHEYSDSYTDSLNPDPLLSGGFPYGKNRADQGGTAMHKLTGANRDLPMMMKALYPEVDLEVVGAPTGKDPRAFPGMLSDRGPMWDRAQRNTEITLRDGVDVQIVVPPEQVNTLGNGDGVFRMVVRVHNKSGHRIPSGYPDGRRFWLSVNVNDQNGASMYQSGVYDETSAELMTDATLPFVRAQADVINAVNPANNAVMVYERVTGSCTDLNGDAIFPDPTAGTPVACTSSAALTNNFILFDNRIPPKGLDYANARLAGIKFWNYDPTTGVPYEDETCDETTGNCVGRYVNNELINGYDQVVYRWRVPAARLAETGFTQNGSVEVYWQTHTREFMEHLRNQDNSTVRPERPPNPLDPNYPNNANYISDSIAGQPLSAYKALPDANGVEADLNDNWGGVAYAAWLATGKGAPFLVDRDDSGVTVAPAAPANVVVAALDSTDPEYIDPVTMAPDAFAAKITWDAVPGADGYMIWIRYGQSDLTADWDRLAVVDANTTRFVEHVLGHAGVGAKSYAFKVVAFNGKGETASDPVDYTIADVAMVGAPNNMIASQTLAEGSTNAQITLSWFDTAINETGFEVWRYGPVNVAGIPTPATQNDVTILGNPNGLPGQIPTQTNGLGVNPVTGTNVFIDDGTRYPGTAPQAESCYLYQVRAVNANADTSTWAVSQNWGCTTMAGIVVTATATVDGVTLTWDPVAGAASYSVSRTDNAGTTVDLGLVTGSSIVDVAVAPLTTYSYTVTAFDSFGTAMNVGSAAVTTPAMLPVAPSNVQTVATVDSILVSWTDNSNNEDGYVIERSANGGVWLPQPNIGAFLPPNSTSYLDSVANGGLLQGVVYQYRVKAIHLVNGDSTYALSAPVSLGAPPTTLLLAPNQFTATLSIDLNGSLPQVNLAWNDVANETGYEVQRHNGSNCNATRNWTDVATLGTDVVQVTDASVPGRRVDYSYCYRLRAINATSMSPWVNVVVTLPARPDAPVMKYVVDGNNLVMEFEAPTGILGYRVERRVRPNGQAWSTWEVVDLVAGSGGGFSFRDPVPSGARYQYRLSYANSGGWSPNTATTVLRR